MSDAEFEVFRHIARYLLGMGIGVGIILVLWGMVR